jgi:glycosyl transferase family 99/capsular polysaccharide biosynthesis protein
MFLYYLNPLPVKAHRWLYSWIRCAALKRFAPGDIGFIGAPWQLRPPSVGEYPGWVHYEVGEISDAGWDEALKVEVPADLCAQITDSQETPLDLLRAQVLDGFQVYRDWLFDQLLPLRDRCHIEAIITHLNCKSLDDVAGYLRIPVIHEESGNLREPAFKFSTRLFDFRGANGNSDFEQRFLARGAMPADGKASIIERYATDATKAEMNAAAEPEFEVGVALQVEDDSNIIAYNNGWDNLRLIYKARQVFPDSRILIRLHPLSLFGLQDLHNRELGTVDRSGSAMEFISKCKRILTINSSVALEAIAAGKPTYILGESPLASMAYRHFDRRVRDQMRDIPLLQEKLEFYALNYLMPMNLWLNPDYYRFRLRAPSEAEIRSRHLDAIEISCRRAERGGQNL